jgi:PD-(D/E)XK nuclease superfamily
VVRTVRAMDGGEGMSEIVEDLPLEADVPEPQTAVEEALFGLIDEAMDNSARSLYAQGKKVGVSDIGGCREYVRRLIADEDFTDPRKAFMAAFMGTAFGDHFERAYLQRHPNAIVQADVVVTLPLEGFEFNLPGHPDIIDPDLNVLIDGKTKDGLAVVRKSGGDLQHKMQVTLYAHACVEAGLLKPNPTLALAYYDRSGVEQAPFIVEWEWDQSILDAAIEWLNDVVYALMQGEEASKDKPRDWCYSFCPFATACRGGDTDVEGLIEDETIVTALDLYREAHLRFNQAKADKETAKKELVGVSGRTKDWVLRWVHVNASERQAYTVREHDKIDIRPNRG